MIRFESLPGKEAEFRKEVLRMSERSRLRPEFFRLLFRKL